MDDLLATKSEDVGLIVFARLVSKIFNLCGFEQTCDSNTALCTVVHRAVKMVEIGMP